LGITIEIAIAIEIEIAIKTHFFKKSAQQKTQNLQPITENR